MFAVAADGDVRATVLFINIWDSLTAPCLVYNTAMYTVGGQCGQYGRCMFIHWSVRPVRPVRGLYGPEYSTQINRELRTQVPDTVTSKSLYYQLNKRQGTATGAHRA